MNIVKQVIILSAERPEHTFEGNRQRTEILKGCLEDCNLAFEVAEGVYNETSETSLVVIVNNEAEIEAVTGLAFQNFNQDAVLHQDSNQEAHLINKDGTGERLGRLEQVTKEVAIEKGNFTLLKGKYYTTIKR